MRADIASLQAERERMAERLSILEINEQRRFPEPNLAQATGNGRELRARLPVVRIGSGGDGSPSAWSEPPSEPLDAPDARPVVQASGAYTSGRVRGRAEASATGRRDRDANGRSDLTVANPEAKRAYDAAAALLRAKRYDAALEALTAFLVRYPDHPSADRAMYWRGECFYAQGDIARAQEQFEGVLARFPFGSQAPEALLKLGICQRRLGATAGAERTFADLKERYPNSDAARQVPAP
jgi:tol-pal system protein YbgF